jgi:hypothetical protein
VEVGFGWVGVAVGAGVELQATRKQARINKI